MIRIVLADDLHMVRQGLRAVIEGAGDIEVVGEGADGIEALDLVGRLQPTVLVTELAMRRLSGFDLTRQVRQRHPGTWVVILSTQANRRYLQEAFANGATGYVVKTAPATELIEAVRTVAGGQCHVSPPLSEGDLNGVSTSREAGVDPYRVLTAREREVLALAAEGRTNAAVGAQLGISPRTVEVHRANLMRKLGLRSQTDLVREALRRGILPPD
jgi:two-component system response regulator NreC